MSNNFVQRNTNYKKRNRKKPPVFKFVVAFLSVAVVVGGIVLCTVLIGNNNTQQASTNPQTSDSPAKEQKPTESSAQDTEKPKPKQAFTGYEGDLKYTEKLIKSDELNDLSSEFIALYDTEKDEITYTKNADKKCYPASTTKLLTAIVASRIMDEDDVITVGDELDLVDPESSVANLIKGEKLTFKQLMLALLLPSGNDAAYTMAVSSARKYTGNDNLPVDEAVKVFTDLMNTAAEELGATNSHFVNPDGWHNDNHYTTAKDLIKIANFARSIDIIKTTMSTYDTLETLVSGEEHYWANSNKLINEGEPCYSPYADGMKTGFTDEAGTSIVASFTKDNVTQIAVVMNGSDVYSKYDDALKLAKVGFKQHNIDFY